MKILFPILALLLAVAAGCQQAPIVPATVKSTPVLIDKAAAASVRVGEGIAELKPLVKEIPVAVSTVARMEADNNDVQVDLGMAGKQAAKDAVAKADVDAALVAAREHSPFRTILQYAAGALVIGGGIGFVVFAFLKNLQMAFLCGGLAILGAAIGILDMLIPTVMRLLVWAAYATGAFLFVVAAFYIWRWIKAKNDALDDAKADTTSIAQSIQTAVKAKLIELTPEAKAVLTEIQTPGAAAVVNEVQGRLPTAAKQQGGQP